LTDISVEARKILSGFVNKPIRIILGCMSVWRMPGGGPVVRMHSADSLTVAVP
jgi:hypothetical protein